MTVKELVDHYIAISETQEGVCIRKGDPYYANGIGEVDEKPCVETSIAQYKNNLHYRKWDKREVLGWSVDYNTIDIILKKE